MKLLLVMTTLVLATSCGGDKFENRMMEFQKQKMAQQKTAEAKEVQGKEDNARLAQSKVKIDLNSVCKFDFSVDKKGRFYADKFEINGNELFQVPYLRSSGDVSTGVNLISVLPDMVILAIEVNHHTEDGEVKRSFFNFQSSHDFFNGEEEGSLYLSLGGFHFTLSCKEE